jgi:hypothetical protein
MALALVAACRSDRREARPDLDLDLEAPVHAAAPLVAFSCRTQITGKRPNGPLEVTFTPASPTDATWQLAFTGPCSYHGALHLVHGRLDDGFLGRAYEYRCTRSPHSLFAVSCGGYLGSDLEVLARGDQLTRTVHVRFPWTFRAGIADRDACELPFVEYDEAGHPQRVSELVFALADCAVSG